MSKGDGKRIAIKFTEPLDGDVAGNETHFTISGKEYEYVGDVNGELIDTEYEVDKVERYPVQRIWELEEQIQLDKTIVGYSADLVPSMTSDTAPTGNVTASSFNNHYLNYPYCAFDDNLTERWCTPLTGGYTTGWIAYEFISPKKIIKYIVSAHVSNATTAPRNWTFEGWNGSEYVILDTQMGIGFTNGEVKEFIISNTKEYIKYRLNATLNNGAAFLAIGELELCEGIYEYITPKIYTTQAIQLIGDYRINWQGDKPIDTDTVIEYTTGETRGEWQAVSNGEVVNANTNLWIKTTLSTEDKKVTPTLQDLWIEPSEAPADTIRLIMNDYFRFNNVAGDLTVFYDGAGSLAGFDGPVEEFTESFTPIGLVAKPHQNNQEHIEISSVSATGKLTRVYFSDIDQAEDQGRIEVLGITSATGVLTHIDNI